MTPIPPINTFLFYLFSLMAVGLALAMVSTPRILRAAVYLMGVLGVSAGFYVLLQAPFLAGIQILVYVGGIVVLLVFAIMLTRSSELLEDAPSTSRKAWASGVATLFFATSFLVFLSTDFFPSSGQTRPVQETAELGRKLLDPGKQGFVLPFEILSLLLLAAVIGGIVLARKTTAPGLEQDSKEKGEIDVR